MSSTLCPLCGHPNQCAMASGQDAATCWCMQRPAPDAARLRAALPAGTPRSCLCPRCLAALAAADPLPPTDSHASPH